jgi:hypothetical protein
VFSRHGARHLVALPARVETLTTGSGDVHLYRAVLQAFDAASAPITLAKAA